MAISDLLISTHFIISFLYRNREYDFNLLQIVGLFMSSDFICSLIILFRSERGLWYWCMAKYLSKAYEDELDEDELDELDEDGLDENELDELVEDNLEERMMKQNGLDILGIPPNSPDHQQPEDAEVHFSETFPPKCFRRSRASITPTKIDLEEEMTDVAGVLRMASKYSQNLHVFNNLKEPVVLELHPWRRSHAKADSESV